MKIIIDILKGIAIGAGGIMPGISSGVLCVVFGIYEKLIDSILNFFKDIKANIKFLVPIGIGGIIGIIIVSKLLQYFLSIYPIQTKSIFIGLIIGGIPLIFKQKQLQGKYKVKNIIFLIIALAIGIFTVYIENKINITTSESNSFIYLFLSGFLMSIGIVVPGVSSTIILMLMGVYYIYLNSVSNLYLPVLVPMGMGIILGSLLFMKIIKILLEKFYKETMYSIIGFSIGSIMVLIPQVTSSVEILISIFCICLGYYSVKFIK